MRKLLGANFVRLKKSKVFWICTGGMVLFGLFRIFQQYQDKVAFGDELYVSLEASLFNHAMVIGILCAVFISLFIGTEYSDGTIRNKLVIGHGRVAVYLSNLITSIAAALLMVIGYTIPVCALGIPLLAPLKAPLHLVAAMALGCILMTAACCSLCTLLSMACQNKTVAAVIALLASVSLLLSATYIKARLEAPEYWNAYVMEGGGEPGLESIPNPQYLRGTERVIYQTALDILPTGQGLQYSLMEAFHLWQMPVYSVGIILLSTGAGIAIFRKKDIK